MEREKRGGEVESERERRAESAGFAEGRPSTPAAARAHFTRSHIGWLAPAAPCGTPGVRCGAAGQGCSAAHTHQLAASAAICAAALSLSLLHSYLTEILFEVGQGLAQLGARCDGGDGAAGAGLKWERERGGA